MPKLDGIYDNPTHEIIVTQPGNDDLRSRVLKEAEKKLGQNYLGATGDNCAHFVRDCFRDAGYVLLETQHPSDLAICKANGYALGPMYANSLAGEEIGRKLPIEDAQPGDIVLFTNVGASSTSLRPRHHHACRHLRRRSYDD
jgi:cell wall-associated NlpC family hydrolase